MGKEEKSGGFSPLIVRWEKIKTDGTCVVELCGCAKRPVNLRWQMELILEISHLRLQNSTE